MCLSVRCVRVCVSGDPYLRTVSLQLHVFELPEAAHGPHLLQVAVERQATQPEAVAAVTDHRQPLHLVRAGRGGAKRLGIRRLSFPGGVQVAATFHTRRFFV